MTFYKTKKIILPVLLLLVILGGINFRPKYALALVPVAEPTAVPVGDKAVTANSFASADKELFMDLASQAMKVVLSNMTQSIVSWINSGFQGSPAFVSNPSRYLVDVGDQIAGNFIAGTELGFMCEPFALDIRLALNLGYNSTFTQRNFCRLSDVVGNTENFGKFTSGDFSQGGWDSWFEITQNTSNNPLGGYISAKNELALRTERGQQLEITKLNWGKGFLSYQECLEQDQNGKCTKYGDIQTPGTVIESQLNSALPTGMRQLELADEFNEIVGALVGQLVQTVFTKGLSSFGPGGSNYGSLQQTNSDTLVSYCSPNIRVAAIGDSVTWSVRVGGGLPGTPTYYWSGHPELLGATSQSVTVTYLTPGDKEGAVTVTKGGQRLYQRCTATVLVE